jgi:hypothetical protein
MIFTSREPFNNAAAFSASHIDDSQGRCLNSLLNTIHVHLYFADGIESLKKDGRASKGSVRDFKFLRSKRALAKLTRSILGVLSDFDEADWGSILLTRSRNCYLLLHFRRACNRCDRRSVWFVKLGSAFANQFAFGSLVACNGLRSGKRKSNYVRRIRRRRIFK